MFMGSRNAPYPAFDAIMESWGGHNNGTTSNDRTNYYEIGPRNLLETFLWLEADRLATLSGRDHRRGAGTAAQGGAERAPPVVREPPLRPRRAGDPGGDVPAEPPVPLAHHRIARGSGGRDRRRRARVLRAVLPAVERQPGDRRRLRSGRGARAWSISISAGSRSCAPPARAPQPATPRLERDVADRADRSRAAAAPAARLAFAGAVRARRRRPGHGGARAGRRQVEPPLQIAGVRQAHRPGRVRVSGLAAARQPVSGRRDRQAGPRPGRAGRRGRPSRSIAWPPRGRPTPSWRARATRTWPTSTRASTTCRRAPTCSITTSTCSAIPAASRATSARYQQTTIASVRDAFARVAATRHLDLRITPEPAAAPTAGDRVIETPAVDGAGAGGRPAADDRPAARDALRADATGSRSSPCGATSRRSCRRRSCSAAAPACDPPGRAGLASIAAEMLDEGAGARDALGIAAELEQLGADLWLGSGRDGSQLSMQAPRETFQAAMAIAADVLIAPAAGASGLAARSQRSANRRRPAPRSARGGRERRLGSDAVRRRPPVRPAGRRARADDRRDHARRRARVPRRPLPPEQRVAGRRRRLRRGDAARRSWRRCWRRGSRRPPPPAPRPLPWPAAPAPGASSIARARPRASCAWSRPAPIVSRPIGPGCRC